MAYRLLFIRIKFIDFGKEQPVADTTISGQISSNPLQTSTSGKSKTALRTNAMFDILLALFQSGGLSGKIIPGVSGGFAIAEGVSPATGAGEGNAMAVPHLNNVNARNKKTGKGAVPDIFAVAGASAAPEKGPAVNPAASLNSGGKASARHVSANAMKADSPALPKAMSKQEGRMPSPDETETKDAKPGKDGPAAAGTHKADGTELKSAAAAQDGRSFRTELAGSIGEKNGVAAAAEQAKSGRETGGERNKAGQKAAEADSASGLKGIIQDSAVKGAEAAALRKGSEAVLKENAGEKTGVHPAGADMPNPESAKIAVRDENRISSPRVEPAEGGLAARSNSPAENGKSAEARADRETPAVPKGEPARTGQALSGAVGIQAASGSSAVSASEGASGEAFNQAVIGQVSGGTIELYRGGGGRVRLSLDPPDLGSVDMDLIVDRNGVKLVLFSEAGEVRNVLQANMDQLRGSLHDQGMNRFDIIVQDRPASDGGGWQAGNSGRESMSGGSGGEGGQSRPGNETGAPAALPGDGKAALAAGRENQSGELNVFA